MARSKASVLKYGGKEYKDMSGRDEYPGQFRLNFNRDDKAVEMVEQRPQLCKPYYSVRYWDAFKAFCDQSGVFGRTWHLYKQIDKDPDPDELRKKIDEASPGEYKRNLEDQLDAVVNRIVVMKTKQKCDSKEELYDKAEKDWKNYKAKLKALIAASKDANVPINAEEGDKSFRGIMLAFVLLDDSVRGACRREYYREKYINPARKKTKKTGYADPISIYDIEKKFKMDKQWQEKFLSRKKNKKT